MISSREGEEKSNFKIKKEKEDGNQEEAEGKRETCRSQRVKAAFIRGEFLGIGGYFWESPGDEGQEAGEDDSETKDGYYKIHYLFLGFNQDWAGGNRLY